jgi:hypothetical protein
VSEPRLSLGGRRSGLGTNEGSGLGDRGVIHHRPNIKLWRSVSSYNHAVLIARELRTPRRERHHDSTATQASVKAPVRSSGIVWGGLRR